MSAEAEAVALAERIEQAVHAAHQNTGKRPNRALVDSTRLPLLRMFAAQRAPYPADRATAFVLEIGGVGIVPVDMVGGPEFVVFHEPERPCANPWHKRECPECGAERVPMMGKPELRHPRLAKKTGL